MRILFFFVHPSKYHLFKYTINYLKSHGHTVDIAIISKDVLEELVKNEGWEYTNIFPEGRRSKSSNKYAILWSTGINFFKTIYRLFKFTKNKKYDLFITDDCLSIVGRLKKVPSLMFIDDDLKTVPENFILYKCATNIITPACTDLKKYNNKKLSVKSYKELAYLHPDYFSPNIEIIKKFNPTILPYAIIRLVALTASHDRCKKGITNDILRKIITILNKKYKVYISTERNLPDDFNEYKIKIKANDIPHAIYFASLLIGDSQTMCSEASVLGTPVIRFNDFSGKINVMEEKENKYGLMYNFSTNEYDNMFSKLNELMNLSDLKKDWKIRKDKMLQNMEDINLFFIKEIEKYKL